MFRWDSSQRFVKSEGKAWLGVALAAWIAVGVFTERRGDAVVSRTASTDTASVNLDAIIVSRSADAPAPPIDTRPEGGDVPRPPEGEAATREATRTRDDQVASARRAGTRTTSPPSAGGRTGVAGPRAAAEPSVIPDTVTAPGPGVSADRTTSATGPDKPSTPPQPSDAAIGPPRWQDVTMAMIEHDILFDRLPPDGGIVTPIAPQDEAPEDDVADELDRIAAALPAWSPGLVSDPIQKVRNLLYIAAVPDVLQQATERHIPALVFAHIQQGFPQETLVKILYWIAVHPEEGDATAANQLEPFGISPPPDIVETRGRAAVYAVKLLGRLTGKRPAR
jgi:hypothetical protein